MAAHTCNPNTEGQIQSESEASLGDNPQNHKQKSFIHTDQRLQPQQPQES